MELWIVCVVGVAATAIWLVVANAARAQAVPASLTGRGTSHQTERLELRRVQRSDLDDFTLSLDPATVKGNGWPAGASDQLIQAFGAPSPEGRFGRLIALERATGETVGFSSISNVDPPEIWSVGVIMSPAKRGQGFAAELLEATFAFAHASGIPVVHVGTATANDTMQAAIDRAGGVFSHTAPHTLPDGSVVDSHWFVHCTSQTLRQSA